MNLVSTAIENYVRRHSVPESPLRTRLAAETKRLTSAPQMMIGQMEAALLQTLIRLSGARRILEIGTFTGYSALAMAEALPPTGRIRTCDVDKTATDIARRFWKQSPHGRKISLTLGPALKTIPAIPGPFDLVFIDADKPNYEAYWQATAKRVRKNGLIVADNTLWSGRVLKPTDHNGRAIARFNRRVVRDLRFEAILLPIRDGITIARKK